VHLRRHLIAADSSNLQDGLANVGTCQHILPPASDLTNALWWRGTRPLLHFYPVRPEILYAGARPPFDKLQLNIAPIHRKKSPIATTIGWSQCTFSPMGTAATHGSWPICFSLN
jgi:hypothetical protein